MSSPQAEAYDQALNDLRALAAVHLKVLDDYRAHRVDDSTYLASVRAMEAANARVDAAESACNALDPINDPHLWEV
jgi:hypothetical protein